MADDWDPLLALHTTTRPTPAFAWPTGSTTPKDVDDQAPIPLIVGIALALFIGFVIIVCCICRRRSLSSSSSQHQNCGTVYQPAPTGEGGGAGGFNAGLAGNSYPMAPVNSLYPSSGQAQQTMVTMSGQSVTGGMNMPTMAQHPPAPQHPYPSLPPNAYTPPYPLGSSPLPAYMPTSQSSHTSSMSGPSSDHGPSGFSSSSPPAPAPAPTGMMAVASLGPTSVTVGGLGHPQSRSLDPAGGPAVLQGGTSEAETALASSCMGSSGYSDTSQGQASYGVQTGYWMQGQTRYEVPGQGIQGQGFGHAGFQMSPINHRGMIGVGRLQGAGYTAQGHDAARLGSQSAAGYPPTMHPTSMDYVPGGGFVPRVGSPMPPGTTVTELDQL